MIFRRRTRAHQIETLDELDELTASGRPVLVDLWQTGCVSCRTMSGIVDELAHEYRDSAHVVKIDVRAVPGAAERFGVRSTPTFVILAKPQKKPSKKTKRRADSVTPRWRGHGLIRKDELARVLERNGAAPAA